MKFLFFGRSKPSDPDRYWYLAPDGRSMVSSHLSPAEMEAAAQLWADEAPAREVAAVAARRAENERWAAARTARRAEEAGRQATAERESRARVDAWHATNPGWSRAGARTSEHTDRGPQHHAEADRAGREWVDPLEICTGSLPWPRW